MSSLRSSGEFGLIHRIKRHRLSYPDGVVLGIGDDSAAFLPSPNMLTLVTTDTFVEGFDFDAAFSTWRQIGFKCMAANASDIAAMGGKPRFALVTLCLPDHRTLEEVDDLYAGLDHFNEVCGTDISIIGGDLSGTTGPSVISITLTGEVSPGQLVSRARAREGDVLCVTGHLGASEAGLRLLQQAHLNPDWLPKLDEFKNTLTKHRTPTPRVLEATLLASSSAVHAMIDISDGLSSDALHLAQSSDVGLLIEMERLPIEEETRRAASVLGVSVTELAFHSGEEFELLCAISPDQVSGLSERLRKETGVSLTPVGIITNPEDGRIRQDVTGRKPLIPEGYEHFPVQGSKSKVQS